MTQAILSIDQGTTSSRTLVFTPAGELLFTAQQEFPQIYPDDGWVEHDPEAIWESTLSTLKQAYDFADNGAYDIIGIGITNQRETTVVWNRKTGKPIYNAIVWQDRRTAKICRALKQAHGEDTLTAKTGLLLDPYFSATKIAWILDHIDGARGAAVSGDLAFGTIDSFLIWRLTGGQSHATDATNASRTNLFNIHSNEWDAGLLELFNVPSQILPEVKDSAADYGRTAHGLLPKQLSILGVAGDQQAAAIGQACFEPGSIKSTYGTGCFVMLNTGSECARSKNRLLSTIAYRIDGKTTYALEGSIFVAGAAVQWLRDGIGIIDDAGETESLVRGTKGNQNVYLVPAFTGLGAPHWDPDARGAIFGLTRDTDRAALVRAALESVCYQTYDLFAAMAEDGLSPTRLRVDGGMAHNDWTMDYLADVLDLPIDRPVVMETTALGAAYLVALQAGLYTSLAEVARNWKAQAHFSPDMSQETRDKALKGWHSAVGKVLSCPDTT